MSFFGVFGGGNSDANCECNKILKDHLRKCAGYGKRPPLMEGCCPPKKDDSPATCTASEKPNCCPTANKRLEVYVPKCEVPPTATFKCPETCCEPPKEKPRCCPPPPPPCSGPMANTCPDMCKSPEEKAKTPCGCIKPKPPPCNKGCGKKSGDSDSCGPAPLKM